ncbi:leukocyte-associated immunoglobulin-like receptor 1 isoform X1 [Artibeus jamaicensis]|uniref:leukocyte-associated immunoglobulin-like receptor 1 isoform X1 n=1 Tax=Artibeus jamaicensis TaxID=9417 RepID=UPI00235A7593|nr:leukocyte-associated immunoglobulin-like receptor 1 isoform X1 [Artibeus jamaicensis]XP_053512674.1 leukocyte-associated immunoglobulin-like receptor 1 isoform X1 [Artibeus jamaicensis]XP_053512675.1 leukocyte-associated immunoglobulin-like receptor 1 isoform X1 [Artibeus jamaicensis]
MGPSPTCLLVLVLCLGQTVHTQEGLLPKPSIRAEPGPVIRRGQPVTIVCRGPAGAELFRLEDKNGRNVLPDQTNVSQRGPHWAEATFHIKAVSEDTAGSYYCRYVSRPSWSERSDILELKVTDEDVSTPPSESSTSRAAPGVGGTGEGPGAREAPWVGGRDTRSLLGPALAFDTRPPDASLLGHRQTDSPDTETSRERWGLSTDHLYILVGVCVASLLCLLLLALLLVRRQHQKKRGPPSSKGEEPRPQERLSPTVDLTESPADVATTVEALVDEENREMHSPSPAAGDAQEVTYAELDQRALTRRAARAESPQPTEPTAESSMYAALPRH